MDEAAAKLEALRRSAGVGLDGEGDFTYAGGPVAHPRVQRLFHQGVSVRSDGEATLTVGRWWCYLNTTGPAFFVEAFRHDDDGRLGAVLRGGRRVGTEGGILGYAGDDDRLYLWVPELGGPAKLLRDAHQLVMQLISALPDARMLDGELKVPQLGLVLVSIDEAPMQCGATSPDVAGRVRSA